jgi:hypothetical protein
MWIMRVLSAAGEVLLVMVVWVGVFRIKKEFVLQIIITINLFVSGFRLVAATVALVMCSQVQIIIRNACVYARDQRLDRSTST